MSTQHIVYPGSAGNYISTERVQLLDADSAHIQQSVGQWTGSSRNGVTQSSVQQIFGDYSLRVESQGTPDQASVSFFGPVGTSGSPCAAATEYTISTWLYLPSGYPTARFRLRTYDAGGSSLGNLYQDFETGLATESWVQVSYTFTSAASAAFIGVVAFDVSPDSGVTGNLPLGIVYYAGKLCLSPGTDSTFVPSLGIVGDLDLRAKVALDDWTPTADQYLIHNLSGFTGYNLGVDTTGAFLSAYGDGSATRAETSTVPSPTLTDGTAHIITAEWDESAGSMEWFLDGVSMGTDSYSAGAGSPSTADLVAGAAGGGASANLAGDLYYIEVRDGIDGPIVAKMLADDAAGAT